MLNPWAIHCKAIKTGLFDRINRIYRMDRARNRMSWPKNNAAATAKAMAIIREDWVAGILQHQITIVLELQPLPG
jgi:hypothetical protein